jgi:hypothetical protein
MDTNILVVAIIFTFTLGVGVGFYLSRVLF